MQDHLPEDLCRSSTIEPLRSLSKNSARETPRVMEFLHFREEHMRDMRAMFKDQAAAMHLPA